jgi:AraC family transcriptional regulator
LDVSKVAGSSTFHGLEIEIQRYPGVRVLRVVHPGPQRIAEHRHDWAYIGLHALGRYREEFDGGEVEMAGPSAVLHPPGRPHADQVGEEGLETLTVEFDRAWLSAHGFERPLDRSLQWSGGRTGRAARQLARLIGRPCSEAAIGRATSAFLNVAYGSEDESAPSWVSDVSEAISRNPANSTQKLARSLELNVDYLARAYRFAVGEGIHESLRRRRVEHAVTLLRRNDRPLVDIALASGFCDQSHMNRCFRAVLGRTPMRVREERELFAPQVAGV